MAKQYKVMSQKDKWFSRKFDPETLEQAINSYASQGWEVVSVATATIPGLGGSRGGAYRRLFTRRLMYFSKFEDVLFVEGDPLGAVTIRPISTQHDGFFSQSQLKSLDTLKKVMADEAKRAGGNAVIRFTYGQKNTFWRKFPQHR